MNARQYAAGVRSGAIVQGPHVRDSCKRFEDDLAAAPASGYWYDDEEEELIARFFREQLVLLEGKYAGQPFELEPCWRFVVGNLMGWKTLDGDGNAVRKHTECWIEIAKGPLALKTPVLTHNRGWTTMERVAVGDLVYAGDGTPTRVVAKSITMLGKECYRLGFDSGESIVASADHDWPVFNNSKFCHPTARADYKRPVRTRTDEIAKTLTFSNGKYKTPRHSLYVTAAKQETGWILPIDPYMLGYWLGDGSKDDARLSCGEKDLPHLLEQIEACGYRAGVVKKQKNHATRIGILGLHKQLRLAGLLGSKHIPEAYKRAGRDDLLALVQGLMDSDGTVGNNGRCTFANTNERLVRDFEECVRILGIKVVESKGKPAKLYGKDCGTVWEPQFTAHSVPVFRLPRKLDRQKRLLVDTDRSKRYAGLFRIRSCEKVESVPVQCITVEHDSHVFLAGRHLIPTHNSAKTPVFAGLALYMLTLDDEWGALIYWVARDAAQASLGFKCAAAMSENSPLLSRMTRVLGGSNPRVIEYAETRSEMLKLAGKAKGKSGGIPSMIVADEIHEHATSDMLDTLRSGIKGSRLQPLFAQVTNSGEGTVDNWIYERHRYSCDVAAGTIRDDQHFSFVCALDAGDDPWTDERCWVKACPTLPKLPGLKEIRKEVGEAISQPSKRAWTARVRFCIWSDDAANPMFTREMWLPCEVDELSPYEARKSRPCYVSLDLGIRRDLTAGGLTWQMEDDSLEFEACPWIPEGAVPDFRKNVSKGVDRWIEDGHLRTCPGRMMDYAFVAEWISELIDRYDDVRCIAYDKAYVVALKQELENRGVPVECVENCVVKDVTPGMVPMISHPQGNQLPVGSRHADALQINMHLAIERTSEAMLKHQLRAKRNMVLRWAVLGAAGQSDERANAFLIKSSKAKIDPAVAMTMGIGTARAWREAEPAPFQVLDING